MTHLFRPGRTAARVRAAAIFAGVSAFTFLSACSSGPKGPVFAMGPVAVRAVAASSATVPLEVSAIGNVEAMASVDVKARVASEIVRVNFQEGQDVHAGDVLFELDQRPFLDSINENEANLARDKALVAQSRANVLKDDANLKSTEAQAARALALQKDGINSREQTETVIATADGWRASRAADQAAVVSAEASVRADEARIEDAKLQLGYTIIKAPISGRAGAIQMKAGNLIKDNDATLVNILQTRPIYVTFSIPDQQLGAVRRYDAGHPLTVEATVSGGVPEQGKLRFIDNTVDTTTGTIKLKAVFDNAHRQLWPGQFVNVRAQLALEPNRIVVPTQTVQTGPTGKFVWVIGPGSAVAMRPVSVLRAWGENSVIASGLQAGEMVITEGQMRLMPGAKVHILKPQTGAEASASASGPSGS
ncbi:MAG: efflux RND transporter periplasmic adaptor subunit [Bryobacteraceae bacterium]